MKIYTNIIQKFTFLFMALFILGSCNDDGDTIYLSTPQSEKLIADTNKAVLLPEIAQRLVLSLTWTESTLYVSNPDMGTPDGLLLTYVEASTDEEFTTNIVESLENNKSKAYTAAELNTLARNLGMEPEVEKTVYFRLGAASGTNMDRVYSNTVAVNVTPYLIDMSFAKILDTNEEDTGITLTSPEENGIYTGFIGATSWYNFYLLEGDGTMWGNYPVDGNAFRISSDDPWDCWFPGLGGCYYTVVNTQSEEWSALYLPSLQISGDLSGEMEYSRPNNRWTYIFNATSSSINIQLSTTGKQYTVATSTDDDAAIDTPVAFIQDGDKLDLASTPQTISVSVPATGESTLIIDLNDPDNWTIKVVSGAEEEDEIPEILYLPGISEGDNPWSFDVFISLYDEANLNYAGVVNVNSAWGYQILKEVDGWGDGYFFGEGDAYEGTLVYQDDNDLPAPTPGLYLIDVSIKGLIYQLTELTNEVYVQGINDVWDFESPLIQTNTHGVYSGEITISTPSSWGFTINIIDGNWERKFGGSDGQLYYKGSEIKDDQSLAAGTYTLTVDLINEIYTIE